MSTSTEGGRQPAALTGYGRSPQPPPATVTMRLADAIGRVEPTWVEAVAVVQAVCAQLPPGQAPPALGDIMVSQSGVVSFPPAGLADADTAIKAVGRLLAAVLRQGDCPMPVWEAMEVSRRSPQTFATPQAFGASLTCFPAQQGPQELAAYFHSARQVVRSARPATAMFGLHGLTARALMLILAVTLGGVGAGMSVGILLVSRTVPPADSRVAPGIVSLLGTAAIMPPLK